MAWSKLIELRGAGGDAWESLRLCFGDALDSVSSAAQGALRHCRAILRLTVQSSFLGHPEFLCNGRH